jgi:hypothetical protein
VAEDRVRGEEAAEVRVVEPPVQVVQPGVRVLPVVPERLRERGARGRRDGEARDVAGGVVALVEG